VSERSLRASERLLRVDAFLQDVSERLLTASRRSLPPSERSLGSAEERLGNDPASELWGEHRSRYRFAAPLVARKRVLDVACGAGFGLAMLAQAGARPFGVDYDAATLCEIRRQSARTAGAVLQADAARLPLSTASVDAVVSFETIEHVPDARALVFELRRVLKPAGQLILSTPNRAFGPPARHTANPFHIREFTADELRDLLAECFASVRLYGQRPVSQYRYVPFLMVELHNEPAALIWKVLARFPFGIKNRLALTLSGRAFYPGETDYCFDADATEGAHVLLAVAQ
jgi:SAM-dependent methyltransferase